LICALGSRCNYKNPFAVIAPDAPRDCSEDTEVRRTLVRSGEGRAGGEGGELEGFQLRKKKRVGDWGAARSLTRIGPLNIVFIPGNFRKRSACVRVCLPA
jgi:hypothetical protein